MKTIMKNLGLSLIGRVTDHKDGVTKFGGVLVKKGVTLREVALTGIPVNGGTSFRVTMERGKQVYFYHWREPKGKPMPPKQNNNCKTVWVNVDGRVVMVTVRRSYRRAGTIFTVSDAYDRKVAVITYKPNAVVPWVCDTNRKWMKSTTVDHLFNEACKSALKGVLK